jgi:mono/diheme cytochrome c family protein
MRRGLKIIAMSIFFAGFLGRFLAGFDMGFPSDIFATRTSASSGLASGLASGLVGGSASGWASDFAGGSTKSLDGNLAQNLVARAAQSRVDFNRDIRPIFRARCASCHGPQKSMAQLRLDNRQLAMKGVVPGNAKESRLFQRILGEGGEARMPLGAEPLSAEQIDLIRRWINEGADWPEPDGEMGRRGDGANKNEAPIHWAFVAPVRPPLSGIKSGAWIKTPVDQFVLARLEKEGMRPSPEADRVTLLRRLSLDLIGLPPTVEEVESFLNDKRPDAYQRQVERLLASPHYGERWGRQWLDAARYADSDGYEKDKSRRVWFYRDWVINALNQDKPYDRFIIEQIAGDLLAATSDPKTAQDQIVATGFLRNSMNNEEGGVDPEQFRMEAMFDRMDAIGKSVLGLTIQCAQCHNHKFDPFKQEEYYRMFAFLNNSHESNIAVYTPDEQMKRADIFQRSHEIEADLRHKKPDWEKRMAEWEDHAKNDLAAATEWKVIQPEIDEDSTGGQRFLPRKDGSFLAAGYAPVKLRVMMTLKTDVRNIAAFRLELLNDPDLPLGGPGRSINGGCALTEFEVETAPASDPKKKTKVKLVHATSDINPPERELEAIFDDKTGNRRLTGPISFAIDGRDDTAWSIDAGPGLRNQPRKAVFQTEKPIGGDGDTILTIYLSQKHGGWNNNDNQQNSLGRFRLSITTAPNAVADPLPAGVREVLSIPRDKRSQAQIQTIFSYWRTTVSEWRGSNEQIEKLWGEYPEGSSQLVLNERGEGRETHLLKRGDFLKPDRIVTPGVPAFLHSLPADASPNHSPNRLDFAKWLVDRNSPTTARSIVNRIWQSYFGAGLVATSEDFGKQSEAPSHPELLDWLAVELMDPIWGGEGEDKETRRQGDKETDGRSDGATGRRGDGASDSQSAIQRSAIRNPQSQAWSLKHIHRLIVNSAVYRQTSKSTSEQLQRDPYNRLLARGPRFRVEAETVRDIALAASGLLNPKIGGPSVYPPAPGFLFDRPFSYGPKVWNEEKGEDRYRRAIYTFRYRSVPYPMLQVFDAPTGDFSCVRRPRSNSPMQALVTLNEPLFVEAARALAMKTLREGGASDAQRMTYAFRRVLARAPTAQESSELIGLLHRQKERFIAGELNPWNLMTDNPDKSFPLPKVDGASIRMEDAAAWTVVARALFNLDETITKE